MALFAAPGNAPGDGNPPRASRVDGLAQARVARHAGWRRRLAALGALAAATALAGTPVRAQDTAANAPKPAAVVHDAPPAPSLPSTIPPTIAPAAAQPASSSVLSPASSPSAASQAQSEAHAPAQDTPLPDLSKMSAQAQAVWLAEAARDGRLEKLDDAQLVTLFESVSPDGLAAYVEHGVSQLDEYEFQMTRQERLGERWQERPEYLDVRYRQSPMQIYAKWLPGGPHKGQEVIYDETRRPGQMYGHLGGLLRAVSIWISLDGAFAHSQSNHSLRDIGLQYAALGFASEVAKFKAAGIDAPSQVDVEEQHGVRLVVFTWESPTGRPAFYAKRERLGIDLRHPWFRSIESFDNDGQPFEKIFYDKVVPRPFSESAFDPSNPDYQF